MRQVLVRKVADSNPAGNIYFELSLAYRSSQLGRAHRNEIKHDFHQE